ncbi:MFS transporter [Cytobacillus firmus]|uniref:MFS transporter n=1 Tax=Cytobacillus firmus TaxID=1399 RepID=UPI002163E9D9|nr:MFS transporter [Cytobacillus firmus]MCS0671257.1 MFS transporter [Cytobacillus firmus]
MTKDIYYGWYIVASASVIVLLTMGLRMGIGPLVNPIMLDFGLSRTEFSIVAAIGMIIYGIGMPLAGLLLKRYSTKFVLLTGLLTVCLSILWTINSIGFFSLLFSFGIFLSLGLSFLSNITLAPIVSKWFVLKRGKALFYLSTGGMAGIAVMTPVEAILIDLVGWQQTLLLFAVLFICVVLPSAIFVMREDVPEGADGSDVHRDTILKDILPEITWKDAFKTKTYWQIVFGMFACGFGMNLMGSHAVPMLMDHHFKPMTASYGVGTIGVVAIFSTLFLGSIADRYPRKNILFWIYLVRGGGFLGLVYAASPWQLFLVSVTGGLVWAGSIAISSAILGDLYGIQLLGILNGWAFLVHQIGGAIGSFIGGWGYERFDTHLISFGLAAVFALLASWASFKLPEKLGHAQNTNISGGQAVVNNKS